MKRKGNKRKMQSFKGEDKLDSSLNKTRPHLLSAFDLGLCQRMKIAG